MKITLDENGIHLPDVAVEDYVREKINLREDIHTSQAVIIDWCRAVMVETPLKERPEVKWFLYGKEVSFDADMRSFDVYFDEKTAVWERALEILITSRPYKSNEQQSSV